MCSKCWRKRSIQGIHNRKWLAQIVTLTHLKPISSKSLLSIFFSFSFRLKTYLSVCLGLFNSFHFKFRIGEWNRHSMETLCEFDGPNNNNNNNFTVDWDKSSARNVHFFFRSSPVGIYQYQKKKKTKTKRCKWLSASLDSTVHMHAGIALVLVLARSLSHTKRTHMQAYLFISFLSLFHSSAMVGSMESSPRHWPLFDHLQKLFKLWMSLDMTKMDGPNQLK